MNVAESPTAHRLAAESSWCGLIVGGRGGDVGRHTISTPIVLAPYQTARFCVGIATPVHFGRTEDEFNPRLDCSVRDSPSLWREVLVCFFDRSAITHTDEVMVWAGPHANIAGLRAYESQWPPPKAVASNVPNVSPAIMLHQPFSQHLSSPLPYLLSSAVGPVPSSPSPNFLCKF